MHDAEGVTTVMVDFWTLFLVFVVVVLHIWWKKTSRGVTLPPGPPTVPFIGNLLSMDPETMLDKFQEYRKKYGDVFSLITGSRILVVINGQEALREFFIKHGNMSSERPDGLITKMGRYKGIGHATGALWKEQRAFTVNALGMFGFGKRSLESRIIEEIEFFLQEIENKKGEPFNIQSLINVSISNIMCSISFGQRYNYDDQIFLLLLDAINRNINNLNVMFVATLLPFVKYIPGDPLQIKNVLKNLNVVENHLRQLVKEHKDTFDENNQRDYIDVFLKKMRSEKDNLKTTFDDDQLLVVLTELLTAGTETTSTAMRWFSLFMIRHPDVQEKMRKEINDVIGTSRFPSLKDKPNMAYSEAVIHETLRMGAIVPLSIPHGLTSNLKYNGFDIPKEAFLIPNLYSVLFDETIFPDPHTFKPERFLDEQGHIQNTEKVLVFSLGPRVCLGEALARMELFLFATSLIQRFRLLPGDDNIPSEKGILGITYAPQELSLKAVSV